MKLVDRTILITGAAGFIGSHLADRLADSNRLVLVDDFSIGSRDNLAGLDGRSGITIVDADVTDRGRMQALTAGVDVVVHMAISCLRTSLNHPVMSHDINAGGTLSACLAARDCGVERFVYVSSSEIYGTAEVTPMSEAHPCRPTTVYGASKLAGELYALACWRTYGLPVSVIRPFNTYGPREPHSGLRAEVIPRFILQLLAGKSPVVYGDGSQTRDFTFVDDTVTGIVRAAECDGLVGDVVNVARGREASILRIGELLQSILGTALPLEFTDPRPGDVDRHFADTTKAQQLFGFSATVDLEQGLSRTVDWIRRSGVASRIDPAAAGERNW